MARDVLLKSATIVVTAVLAGCGKEPSTDGDAETSETDGTTASSGEESTSGTQESGTESTSESETESDSSETGEPGCGDGVVGEGEECDDGNLESFDGCSTACGVEHEILQLAVGVWGSHRCVVTLGGGLKCWGANGGNLGLGDMESRGDGPGEMGASLPYVDVGFEVVEIALGYTEVCVAGPSGELKCWGRNAFGQLGLGDTEHRGDEPGEMGDALPLVDLSGPATWVAHGFNDGCAGMGNGKLKCWGYNMNGTLGLGDEQTRGDGPGEMGDALPFVDLGMSAVHAALFGGAACAGDDQGRVKCWGTNSYGTLGLGDTEDRGDEPGEMGEDLPFVDLGADAVARQMARGGQATCVVLESGGLKCWGTTNVPNYTLWPGADTFTGDQPEDMGDALPELTTGDGRDIVEVGVGQRFACVRLDDGGVRCFGSNEYGQLGLGHADAVVKWLEDIPDVDIGEPAEQIGVGNAHACALLESGNVKCWGRGESSGLGYGDTENRGDEPGEMGDDLPYVELF